MYEEEFLVFKSPLNNKRVKITSPVMAIFRKYIQIGNNRNEAGGILIGRLILESSNIVIDKVSIPQKKDRRNRFLFFRHFRGHQKVINRIWKQSKGTFNYLGEWHTHPQDIPIPSSVDVKSWEKLAKKVQSELDFLLFIIVGREELCIYEISRNDYLLTKLIWEKIDEKT
jgi:integrative and conjugative element protein (TIGR02256 family)